MIKKALKKLSKESLKKGDNVKKENFVQYMELIDDDLILYHRAKSFNQVLSFDEAIEILIDNKNIFITSELNDVLEKFYKQDISA